MIARSLAIFLLAVAACGGAAAVVPPSSELPRTTASGITITYDETVERLPIPGCNASQGGDVECEVDTVVRVYTATANGREVTTTVLGEPNHGTFFSMELPGQATDGTLTLMVVLAPVDATAVRMLSASGTVLDEVMATSPLVALAGTDASPLVAAIDASGATIAQCSLEGFLIDDVIYICTPAGSPPVTTTP